jgi:RHS repeat-associated protein
LKLYYTPEGWVDALAGDQQNLVERYDYDLNGQATVLDVTGAPLLDAQGQPAVPLSRFLFQRRPYDATAGLYQYRLRWYHPGLGQFLTPDPTGFGHGANLYVLNHGDPVNFRDSLGLQDETSERSSKGPVRESWSDKLKYGAEYGWALVSGFYEGEVVGARQLLNQATGTIFEKQLRPDNPLDRDLFDKVEMPATVGIGAATIVISGPISAGRGGIWAARGLQALRTFEALGSAKRVAVGSKKVAEGDSWGWLDIGTGALGLTAAWKAVFTPLVWRKFAQRSVGTVATTKWGVVGKLLWRLDDELRGFFKTAGQGGSGISATGQASIDGKRASNGCAHSCR